MNKDDYVVVIGGANVDIGGTPYNELIPEDSNPGRITVTFGGVGRNIAHNLANLGVNTKLITAVGLNVKQNFPGKVNSFFFPR
jgi:pseudouridine kinase